MSVQFNTTKQNTTTEDKKRLKQNNRLIGALTPLPHLNNLFGTVFLASVFRGNADLTICYYSSIFGLQRGRRQRQATVSSGDRTEKEGRGNQVGRGQKKSSFRK